MPHVVLDNSPTILLDFIYFCSSYLYVNSRASILDLPSTNSSVGKYVLFGGECNIHTEYFISNFSTHHPNLLGFVSLLLPWT